jgi:hypothetical protein
MIAALDQSALLQVVNQDHQPARQDVQLVPERLLTEFGSAIPLGLFTATAVSQLQFLGVRAAGTSIALFGGFATATTMLASAAVL